MKGKILSIFEVSIVFVLMIGLFRFVYSMPLAIKITDSSIDRLIPGYTALLIASFCIYFFMGKRQRQLPDSLKLKYQLDITAYGFFPFFILGVLLSRIDWTQWIGASLISAIEIGLLFWFSWMARNKPAWQNSSVINCCLLFPVASQTAGNFTSVIIVIIYFYFLVALSEELLFRGYIQTRLNSVFDRPNRFYGIRWGSGLVISSLFFGLWHLGWLSSPQEWPHVLWTIFAGLILGFVREKSESIIAPAILHGIMNYGPQAILNSLFWIR